VDRVREDVLEQFYNRAPPLWRFGLDRSVLIEAENCPGQGVRHQPGDSVSGHPTRLHRHLLLEPFGTGSVVVSGRTTSQCFKSSKAVSGTASSAKPHSRHTSTVSEKPTGVLLRDSCRLSKHNVSSARKSCWFSDPHALQVTLGPSGRWTVIFGGRLQLAFVRLPCSKRLGPATTRHYNGFTQQ
jgi:hypothetical protein